MELNTAWRAVVPMLVAVMILVMATPSPAAAESPEDLRSVGVVGDSLLKEADDQIVAALEAQGRPIAHLDARNGVTVDDVRPDLVQAVNSPGGPEILVIVLGTAQANVNYWPFESSSAVGARWEADLRRLLVEVTPHVSCTRVFDMQERKTGFYLGVDRRAPEMNAVTRRVVAEFGSTEYFHYKAWTDLVGLLYDAGDGLHHDGPGRWAMARLVRSAADGCDPTTSTVPFWDVPPGHWAGADIEWSAAEGLMSGYDNNTFRTTIDRVAVPLTRGQAIRALWRLMDEPTAAQPHGWQDGRPWIEAALDWAWETEVARGFTDGTFRAAASVTRAQMARMIWRLAGSPATDAEHPWVDGPAWADPALDWIAESGLMTGWTDGTFRPDEPISRAAAARLIHRFHAIPTAPPVAEALTPEATTTTVSPPTTTTVSPSTTSIAPPTTESAPTTIQADPSF